MVLPVGMHWQVTLPIFAIGTAHALNSTLAVPIVNKVVARNQHAQVLSTTKIIEGINIGMFMYIFGRIRETTGSYDEVSGIIIASCFVGVGVSFWLKSLMERQPTNPKPISM